MEVERHRTLKAELTHNAMYTLPEESGIIFIDDWLPMQTFAFLANVGRSFIVIVARLTSSTLIFSSLKRTPKV